MTRFIRPLTVSVVVARLATSRPMPGEGQGADHVDQRSPGARFPRIGMPKASVPSSSSTARSGIRKVSRAPEEGQQEVAPGHRRGDEALEQLGDPEVHQQEADPPEPAPHGVQADQAGDQEVDVA